MAYWTNLVVCLFTRISAASFGCWARLRGRSVICSDALPALKGWAENITFMLIIDVKMAEIRWTITMHHSKAYAWLLTHGGKWEREWMSHQRKDPPDSHLLRNSLPHPWSNTLGGVSSRLNRLQWVFAVGWVQRTIGASLIWRSGEWRPRFHPQPNPQPDFASNASLQVGRMLPIVNDGHSSHDIAKLIWNWNLVRIGSRGPESGTTLSFPMMSGSVLSLTRWWVEDDRV